MKRYTLLLIGALLALMALAGGAGAAVEPGAVTLSGVFSILSGDPFDPALPPVERYFLTDDAGATTELSLDPAVTDVRALDGRRVTVSGDLDEASGLLRLAVVEVGPEARPAEAGATAYTKPWLTVACKFPDVAVQQHDVAYFRGMYGSEYPRLSHYWQAMTDGQMAISGDAAGWFTLPRPRAGYLQADGKTDLWLLLDECVAAADPFVYFPAGVSLNLAFNEILTPNYASGSTYNLTLDGNQVYGVTWLPPWAFDNLSVVAHEMGHTSYLYHTRHPNPELGVYSNPWDVMSDTWYRCDVNSDPVYGCIPQNLAAVHNRGDRGWPWPQERIYTPHEGAQTVVLENASTHAPEGYLAVILPAGYQTNYWIEARSREGYDARLPGEGVIIHHEEFDTYWTGIAGYLVDRDPWGNGRTDTAIWSPGEVFAGWYSYVRVLERTASGGYRLEIVVGADSETTELSPTADTYVNSAQPAATYGANLAVHTLNGAATRRAYLKFDTAGLPDTILEARLKLMPTMVEAGAEFGRIFAAPCAYAGTSTPWTESGLNWNNAPPPPATHAMDEIDILAEVGHLYSFEVTPAMLGAAETCFVVEATTDYLIKFSSKEGPTPPVLVVTYLLAPEPPNTTTTFAPTNDAYVMQAKPNNVFGAKPILQVKDAAKDVNSYIKFNVSGLTGTVQSATLRLWVNDPGPDGGAVYAVSPFYLNTTTQWLETGLRWNNAPAITGAPLDSVGNAVKGQWVELDVTSAVVAALGDNGRVSLAIANDSRNLVVYGSKEGPHPPELVIVTSQE